MFISLLLPSAMCFQIVGCFGPVANFTNFFVCGVPGGLDYLMLALVKHGKILPLTEKYYNNILNVWYVSEKTNPINSFNSSFK
jgi:hypothetical protein